MTAITAHRSVRVIVMGDVSRLRSWPRRRVGVVVARPRGKRRSRSRSEDSSPSLFRGAPLASASSQAQLANFSRKFPGRLAARLLRKMRAGLGLVGGAAQDERDVPDVALSYFVGIMIPQHRDRMNLRFQRELRSWSTALDFLARGETGLAADLAAQRIKAIEQAIVDGSWTKGQYLELIEAEGATLLDKSEQVYLGREVELEARLRGASGGQSSSSGAHPAIEPAASSQPWQSGGKAKGKGKGKKGRGYPSQ